LNAAISARHHYSVVVLVVIIVIHLIHIHVTLVESEENSWLKIDFKMFHFIHFKEQILFHKHAHKL